MSFRPMYPDGEDVQCNDCGAVLSGEDVAGHRCPNRPQPKSEEQKPWCKRPCETCTADDGTCPDQHWLDTIQSLTAQLAEKDAQIAAMDAALEYYAAPEIQDGGTPLPGIIPTLAQDRGDIAKEARSLTPSDALKQRETEREVVAGHVALLTAVAHDGQMPTLIKQRNVYRLGQKLLKDLSIPPGVIADAQEKVADALAALKEVQS